MKADRTLLRIIRQFDLDLRDVRREKRGVYQLTTRRGEQLCLKRMGFAEERLLWMDRTLSELRRAGWHGLAWRNPQKRHGKRLFVKTARNDAPYILTPWLQGRLPSARSTKDMHTVAQALARFHKLSQSIRVPEQGMDNWLGQWPQRLQARAELLEKHIDQAKRQAKRQARRQERSPAMAKLLARHGDRILKRAEMALYLLKKSDYRTRCKQAARKLTVCHGDSGPKNFVLTDRGPYLIDFETLRVDLRIYDVYRMIRLACKEVGWDLATAKTILDGYQSVSPLETGEFDLLLVWLIFPQKAHRTLVRYDRAQGSKRSDEADQLARKMRDALDEEEGLTDFLKGLHAYKSKR